MKRQLYYLAIITALILLALELSYINAKSLLFLIADSGPIDRLFAIVGSVAFSSVTVIVMYTTRNRTIRLLFPSFDALLMFAGLNLRFYNTLYENPIAFWLTILFSVYTGVIMYSLGAIGTRYARRKKR